MSANDKVDLADIEAMANELDGTLTVEDFGIYLTRAGATDDIELGRTAKDAKATLIRMLDRALRAEALRNGR